MDGSASLSALARRIGQAPPATSKRVKRLESLGVIESYAARVNFQAVGLDLLAIARVKTSFEKLPDCLKLFAAMPEILEVHRVTGEECFVLKVLVPKAAQLESVIDRLAKYCSVTTSIMLSSMRPAPITHRTLAST